MLLGGTDWQRQSGAGSAKQETRHRCTFAIWPFPPHFLCRDEASQHLPICFDKGSCSQPHPAQPLCLQPATPGSIGTTERGKRKKEKKKKRKKNKNNNNNKSSFSGKLVQHSSLPSPVLGKPCTHPAKKEACKHRRECSRCTPHCTPAYPKRMRMGIFARAQLCAHLPPRTEHANVGAAA